MDKLHLKHLCKEVKDDRSKRICENKKWSFEEANDYLAETEDMIETIQNNQERKMIKDINNFKRELKREGLYSNKLDDFIEDYMKYYNN